MFPDVSVEARGEAAVGERVRRCVRRAVVGVREASMSCQQRNVISAWGSKSGVCNPGEEDGEGGGVCRKRSYVQHQSPACSSRVYSAGISSPGA